MKKIMSKRDNSGFSLVELIVVIAIMAVAVTVMTVTLHLVISTRSKSTAAKMKTAIENTRQQAMARGGGSVTFSIHDDGTIWVSQNITNGTGGGAAAIKTTGEQIGSKSITVECKQTDGSWKNLSELDDKKVTLTFNAGSGSFSGTIPDAIRVTGGGKSYVLTLYSLTGKVTLE